ncbi:PAS domain S-box protein [Limnobacter sp.]|uniref:PAS domain S-box protein n=1 Tax=Limnobacter sp. TaxID=2003368 RepID=UPI003510E2D3
MLDQTRLLLVDDERPQLEALSSLLQDAGFGVRAYPDPEQALEALRVEAFDLLLTDLRLPGMSGLDLVQQAKAIDPDLCAVLMTGHGSIQTAVDAMKVGVLDYILKPFKVSDIMPVIHRALEVRRLRRENKALLEYMADSNQRLTELNAELDTFAGRVAHDLNSLIHIIQGFAGSLQRRAANKLDEQELRYLNRIGETSERGGQLVSDLLAFARLGTGDLKVQMVALGEVVEKARAQVEAGQQETKTIWHIGQMPELEGDESLLEQVFTNLFSNAVKFSQIRDVPEITVEATVDGEMVDICVSDNGAGFDPDKIDRLFKPFQRLHNAHDFQGHGMGLANVKRIIERHGGYIQAHSVPGEGASFTFTLPMRHRKADKTQPTPPVKTTPRIVGLARHPKRMELLDACVERLNDIVMITEASPLTSPGPRIVYVNSAFERITGYRREEVIGKSPRMLQGPLTDPDTLKSIRADLEQGKSVHTELVNYGKSRKPHWLEMDIVPVVAADGSVPYFASIQRDITERRKAADHLARTEALQRIGGRLARLGGWAIDLDEPLKLYWSEEIFDMLDLPQGQLPASFEEGMKFYIGKWRDLVHQALLKCSREGTPFEMEPELVSSTGRRFWARVVGEAVRNTQGEIVRVQGAFQDITESKVNALTLKYMNGLLEAQQKLHDAARKFTQPKTLYQQVCSIFCAKGGLPLAWVCEYDKAVGDLRVLAADGAQQEFVPRIMASTTLPKDDVLVQRLRSGSLYICQNVADEPQATMWHAQALQEGLESFAILPIHADGLLRASLVLFGSGVHFFTPEVTQLLKAVSNNLSFTLDRIIHADERNKNAERLKLLETCVERLNDIVIITEAEPVNDPGPRILYVNEAFVRRTGYSREEVIGQTPRILQGEQTQRDTLDRIRKALQEWKPVREELINYTKNGETFWLELDIVPVSDESGWYTHWVAIERDITERKHAEAALKEGQERFRLVASATRDSIWDWDIVNNQLWWSDGYEKQFGHRIDKFTPILGSWKSRVHPDDLDRVLKSLNEALENGQERWQEEYRFLHGDGGWVDVLDRGNIIRNSKNKPIRMIGGLTDMTHIRQSERRSRAQLARMNLLNEITRAIGARDDLASIYQVVSRSIERELPADFSLTAAYDPDAQTITFMSMGENTEPMAAEIGFFLHQPVPARGVHLARAIAGEFVYQPNLGSSFCLTGEDMHGKAGLDSMVLAPLMKDGKVLGVIAVARRGLNAFSQEELDFLRQLAEHVGLALAQTSLLKELQSAYDNLQQTQQLVLQQERLRALAEMAGGIAHDINNAISPVTLYTDALLNSEVGLSERGKKQLSTIQLAIEDVSRTVERMSQFSRGRADLPTLSPINIAQICEQCRELTRARWHDMPQKSGLRIAFNLECETGIPPVEAPESELREALINLIFNAVDALPTGGRIVLKAQMKTCEKQSWLCLSVQDNGIGMSEETRKRCLEPFYTTKGERGTGLGLAMVYGIVQRMQGKVDVDSRVGEGTTVTLCLPAHARLQAKAPEPAALAAPTGPMHVLLIDDDVKVLQALADGLRARGFYVSVCESGREGVQTFEHALQTQQPVDVVITDLGMPGMDGIRVSEAVRAMAPKCPIYMLTGWARQLDFEHESMRHVNKVLAKPPKISEIVAALNELQPQRKA